MSTSLANGLQWLVLLAAAGVSLPRSAGKRKRVDQALCDAASCGNASRVRELLADGVSENSADEDGTTALMAAAFSGEEQIIRLLLEHGADPNLQDEAGQTALMNAVIADGEMDLEGAHPVFQRIIELLLDAGADPSLEDENEFTAADFAESYELEELARLLEGD